MKKEQGNRGIKSGAKGGRRAWHLGRVSSCSVSQGGSGVGGTRPWGRWGSRGALRSIRGHLHSLPEDPPLKQQGGGQKETLPTGASLGCCWSRGDMSTCRQESSGQLFPEIRDLLTQPPIQPRRICFWRNGTMPLNKTKSPYHLELSKRKSQLIYTSTPQVSPKAPHGPQGLQPGFQKSLKCDSAP